MKKFLPLLVLISFIFVAAGVSAIPNPAPIYCTEMGYEVETVEGTEYCVFNENKQCETWEFYNGECGSEYVKELPCTETGEGNLPGHKCCKGLETIGEAKYANGICDYAIGGWSICAPCGNGVCDEELENECNCPEDCKRKCAENGERVYMDPGFGPTYCCSKNAGIKSNSYLTEEGYCIATPDGSKGTCVDNWWETCGDGICSNTEDICTCPEDCEEEPCVCPMIWEPVCGVDGHTYGNKCEAACEGVEVAYEGKCEQETIKVEIGEKFELNEGQKAILLEDGENTGITVRLSDIVYPKKRLSNNGKYYTDMIEPFAQVEVSKVEGNTGAGTVFNLYEGQSEEVFGIKISNLNMSTSQVVFLTEQEYVPDVVKAYLGEEFKLLEDQTARILKGSETVMKMSFEGVIQAVCERTSTNSNRYNEMCQSEPYAQFQVSIASGGVHYLGMREGQTQQVGNYTVYLESLNKGRDRYSAVLVVKELGDPDTIVVYLDEPFNLWLEQKAIVRETQLQLRFLDYDLGSEVIVLEVWQPVKRVMTEAQTSTINEGEERAIQEKVKAAVQTGSVDYRPYIKIKAGEKEEIYGHVIKFDGFIMPHCSVEDAMEDICKAGGIAGNLTVSKTDQPDVKQVYLNQKFDLKQDEKADVISLAEIYPPIRLMRVELLGIGYPACESIEEDEDVWCDTRPIAKVSVELPYTECEAESGECTSTGMLLTMREGEERSVAGYRLRLLDISGEKAWFIVKDSASDVIKVRLDELFKLQQKQTAFVVEEDLYVRLESIAMVRCTEQETRCIGGSFAEISVWKNIPYMDSEEVPIALYTIKQGETLNLHGMKITLRELAANSAKFIVTKDSGNTINVHVDEPFKLQQRQNARVLEANMQIQLLNIIHYKTEPCKENEKCLGVPAEVEISVSNYLLSKAMTGKAVQKKDYLETVVESEVEQDVEEVIPIPPMPFNTYVLTEGESVVVNDFVIKCLGISYSSAEFIVTEKGSGKRMKISFVNGWNLFSIPGELDTIESGECDSRDFKLFEYIEEKGAFVEVTEPESGQAYWLHNPGSTCSAVAIIKQPIKLQEIDSMKVGWNFVPVLVDMLGSKIRDLAAGCEPEAAYFYNAESSQWQNAMDRTLSESDLGKGFAIYATKECRLGGSSTETEPPMPDFPEIPVSN